MIEAVLFVLAIIWCVAAAGSKKAGETRQKELTRRREEDVSRVSKLYCNRELEMQIVDKLRKDRTEVERIVDKLRKEFEGRDGIMLNPRWKSRLSIDMNGIAVNRSWMPIYLYALAEQGIVPDWMARCTGVNVGFFHGLFIHKEPAITRDDILYERDVFMPWYAKFLRAHVDDASALHLIYCGAAGSMAVGFEGILTTGDSPPELIRKY